MNTLQKVYRYDQLNEEAKEVAVNEVYELEYLHYQNESFVYEQMYDIIIQQLKEMHLVIERDEIEWEYNYGFSLDISETKAGVNTFYEHHLSPEDYNIFCEMQELLEDVMEVTFFGRDKEDGIQIEPNIRAYDIEDEIAVLNFIVNHTTDEDLKNKYKLPLLFMETSEDEEELPDELREDLDFDFEQVAEHHSKRLSNLLNSLLAPKYAQIYHRAKGVIDHYGSITYFKDELESKGCSLEERYLFNNEGKIILKDDEFEQSDYINIYMEYAEE